MASHISRNNQLNPRYYKHKICNKLPGSKITPCSQCGQDCDQGGKNWFLRGEINLEITTHYGPPKCQNTSSDMQYSCGIKISC